MDSTLCGDGHMQATIALGMAKPILLIVSLLTVAFAGCTGTSDEPNTEIPAHGHDASAGDAVLDQLRALYVDQPMKGGQATPSHTWLDNGDGTIHFLHWNDADPMMATGLLFVGDAFYAQGCVGAAGITQDDIDAGYAHFHKETHADWNQGHHTDDDPTTMGYWFRHVAAAANVDPMGVGASDIGDAYPLMVSYEDAPACSLL